MTALYVSLVFLQKYAIHYQYIIIKVLKGKQKRQLTIFSLHFSFCVDRPKNRYRIPSCAVFQVSRDPSSWCPQATTLCPSTWSSLLRVHPRTVAAHLASRHGDRSRKGSCARRRKLSAQLMERFDKDNDGEYSAKEVRVLAGALR